VRVSVAGLAVTPAGSPVRVTATGLEKPFTALAETLMGIPAAPAVRVSEAGAAVRVKSGVGAEAAVMVAETEAEWLNAPDVPVRVMAALPAAAEEAAERVTVWAVPGVRVRVAGWAVTPLGRPAMVTATLEVKPFSGEAFTLMVWLGPPAVSATVAGVAEREKSGVTGGLTPLGTDPPPQEARRKRRHNPGMAERDFGKTFMAYTLTSNGRDSRLDADFGN
jgi:hypothetical protein